MSLTKLYVIVITFCFILFAGCCGSSSSSSAVSKDAVPVSTQSSGSNYQPTKIVAEPAGPVTAGLNQNLIVDSWLANAQISVDDVIRGSSANRIIAESNMFNSEPDNGYEYLLVNIRVKNTGDDSLSVSPYFDFPVYVSGASYDQEIVVLEGYRDLESTDLLPNGQINGWLAYMVPIGESAKLAYEPLLASEPLGFISLS